MSCGPWRLDQACISGVRRTASAFSFYCSRLDKPVRGTHVAKLLAGDISLVQRQAFERQAAISLQTAHSSGASVSGGFATLVDCSLETPPYWLVYPRLSGIPCDVWAAGWSQAPPRRVWLHIGHQLLRALQVLHELGYAHLNLGLEHLLIDRDERAVLLGLGSCRPVGSKICEQSLSDGVSAPELWCSEAEVSSAADIYSAAYLIDDLSGGRFAGSPIWQLMLSENPESRPTASELGELFDCYLKELQAFQSQTRAA
jgi:serine/threonine protein kinase